jgi:IS30 family transposase
VQKEDPLKNNNRYLILSQRIIFDQGLNDEKPFTAISKSIGKDPSTISKEVQKHRSIKYRRDPGKIPGYAR